MKRFFVASAADQDVTVSSQELEHQLDDCDPKTCVLYSHSPSVQVYFALRNRLENSSEAWMHEFISLDGLESLLDSLCCMVGPKFSSFSDAILQIDCLFCIRTVLNSRVGMDAMVTSPGGLKKLLKGVDLANTLPRKHVIEILSVICVYSEHSYKNLLEALEEHKRDTHMYHRFSFIVNELKLAETVPHKTAVLTLINSIICSASDQQTRCRIRSEFIGLTLLDVLAFLQREDTDEDLSIQLQVFQDKKHEDEIANDLNSSLDLSSPQDLTDAIQNRVFGSAKMVSFVNILQDLLAVETSNKQKSEVVWQILEQHVHHLVHAADNVVSLSSLERETMCQAIEMASRDSSGKACTCARLHSGRPPHAHTGKPENSVKEVGCNTGQKSSQSENREVVSLKTSADSGYLGCEEKTSPPNGNRGSKDVSSSQNVSPVHSKVQSFVSGHTRDNELCNNGHAEDIGKPVALNANERQVSMYDNMSNERELFSSKMATPKKDRCDKHKQFKQNNLNIQRDDTVADAAFSVTTTMNILSNTNVVLRNLQPPLRLLENAHQTNNLPLSQLHNPQYLQWKPSSLNFNTIVFPTCSMKNLKWIKLDDSVVELFPHSLWESASSRNFKCQLDFKKVEELFKETNIPGENTETPLLSNEARVSLNLFLNRLEEEPTELVRRLLRMEGPPLSLPFIKHLTDILPEYAEVKLLKQYNGNLLDLGAAEQFILHLSDLPDYRVLVTGHLRRAEFAVAAPRLRSVLGSMLDVSRAVLCSDGLKQILLLLLKLGNFLNYNQFNGYAAGFKLSSLRRLADVKSNESGQNLVHFLVSVAESGDERLLGFLSEIPRLEKASSYSPSDIKDEFDKINTEINSFVRQLAGANTIIREGFDAFLEEVKSEFRELQGQITELKFQSQRLSEFFCESEGFELQSCFKSLLNFFKELRRCRHEIRMLQKQKAMAIKQSNMFKQQLARKNNALKFGQKAGANSSAVELKTLLVEEFITELHRGNFQPSPIIFGDLPVDLQTPACAKTPGNDARGIDSAPELPAKSVPVGQAKGREGTVTPDRDLNAMELSRISVVGTPMINRPRSYMYDEDITLTAEDHRAELVTSSVQDLRKGLGSQAPPVLSLQHPLSRVTSRNPKTHHRSRSDLGESMNGSTKWIRYQHQLRQDFQAPLARPESSKTLATLNLESVGTRHPLTLTQPARHAALVLGPTIAMPSCVDSCDDLEPQEFVRGGKKGERKSGTLSNFLTKISKRVLRQKANPEQQNFGAAGRTRDSNSGSEDGADRWDGPGESRGALRAKPTPGNSMGRAAGTQVLGKKSKVEDKENVSDANPFDRQKKNPIRLSNRLKSKLTK